MNKMIDSVKCSGPRDMRLLYVNAGWWRAARCRGRTAGPEIIREGPSGEKTSSAGPTRRRRRRGAMEDISSRGWWWEPASCVRAELLGTTVY